MVDVELLMRMKARLPEIKGSEKDAILMECILDATAQVKAYTNRKVILEEMESALVRLAVVKYNLMGMEGEKSHSEGGMSIQVDAFPSEIKDMLKPYRTVRTV